MLGGALTVLKVIAGTLANLGGWVTFGMATALNALIAAVGASANFVVGLMPQLPAVPDAPEGIQTLNWLFPVGAVVGIWVTMGSLYISFLAIRALAKRVLAL
jgi:hypothetical protein